MVFISKTAHEPYDPVGEFLQPPTEVYTLGRTTFDVVKSEPAPLYLVVQNDWFDEIEIKVENEHEIGVSLYISFVDPMDKPLNWTKKLTLQNIYARTSDYIHKFVYQWRVINNIYFVGTVLRKGTATAKISVYGMKYIST